MSRTCEILDKETGETTRRLAVDAREMLRNDPARYELVGLAVKSDVKIVAEPTGSGRHALRRGTIKLEPL